MVDIKGNSIKNVNSTSDIQAESLLINDNKYAAHSENIYTVCIPEELKKHFVIHPVNKQHDGEVHAWVRKFDPEHFGSAINLDASSLIKNNSEDKQTIAFMYKNVYFNFSDVIYIAKNGNIFVPKGTFGKIFLDGKEYLATGPTFIFPLFMNKQNISDSMFPFPSIFLKGDIDSASDCLVKEGNGTPLPRREEEIKKYLVFPEYINFLNYNKNGGLNLNKPTAQEKNDPAYNRSVEELERLAKRYFEVERALGNITEPDPIVVDGFFDKNTEAAAFKNFQNSIIKGAKDLNFGRQTKQALIDKQLAFFDVAGTKTNYSPSDLSLVLGYAHFMNSPGVFVQNQKFKGLLRRLESAKTKKEEELGQNVGDEKTRAKRSCVIYYNAFTRTILGLPPLVGSGLGFVESMVNGIDPKLYEDVTDKVVNPENDIITNAAMNSIYQNRKKLYTYMNSAGFSSFVDEYKESFEKRIPFRLEDVVNNPKLGKLFSETGKTHPFFLELELFLNKTGSVNYSFSDIDGSRPFLFSGKYFSELTNDKASLGKLSKWCLLLNKYKQNAIISFDKSEDIFFKEFDQFLTTQIEKQRKINPTKFDKISAESYYYNNPPNSTSKRGLKIGELVSDFILNDDGSVDLQVFNEFSKVFKKNPYKKFNMGLIESKQMPTSYRLEDEFKLRLKIASAKGFITFNGDDKSFIDWDNQIAYLSFDVGAGKMAKVPSSQINMDVPVDFNRHIAAVVGTIGASSLGIEQFFNKSSFYNSVGWYSSLNRVFSKKMTCEPFIFHHFGITRAGSPNVLFQPLSDAFPIANIYQWGAGRVGKITDEALNDIFQEKQKIAAVVRDVKKNSKPSIEQL